MPLSKGTIKGIVKAMLDANMENEDAANSRDEAAAKIADAICEAVKTGIRGVLLSLFLRHRQAR